MAEESIDEVVVIDNTSIERRSKEVVNHICLIPQTHRLYINPDKRSFPGPSANSLYSNGAGYAKRDYIELHVDSWRDSDNNVYRCSFNWGTPPLPGFCICRVFPIGKGRRFTKPNDAGYIASIQFLNGMYWDVGINGVRAQVIHASEMTEEEGFFGIGTGLSHTKRLFLKKDDIISLRCVTVYGKSIDVCRFKVDLATDPNELIDMSNDKDGEENGVEENIGNSTAIGGSIGENRKRKKRDSLERARNWSEESGGGGKKRSYEDDSESGGGGKRRSYEDDSEEEETTVSSGNGEGVSRETRRIMDEIAATEGGLTLEELPYVVPSIYMPPGGENPTANIDQQVQWTEFLTQPGALLAVEEAVRGGEDEDEGGGGGQKGGVQ
ncbi:hypothetical protein TrCOL_g10132 [Triparma columacea]|uniref:Uncharacterized protein n=1 Tax=Triparma columacea TaxID=722753 RepID=A0A9W7G2D2_9STRA|nr:hypothetical protein TrCOL_g10132 [Triparma columacea]